MSKFDASCEGEASDDTALLDAEVTRLLEESGLGRSPTLERLLRFLHQRARENQPPKEIEIADAVFDRGDADMASDASVRVHIHRLRRKLDNYYAGPAQDRPWRLHLPKGSYLLGIIPLTEEEAPPPAVEPPPIAAPRPGRILPALMAAAALVAGLAGGYWYGGITPLSRMRDTPFWHPITQSDLPATIILGDYYIFGERTPDGTVDRMVREFSVNSAQDLQGFKDMGGDPQGRYVDLGLTYLPVGIGPAIRAISPILAGDKAALQVEPISQMDAQAPKNPLVYLGYISGLGALRTPVFQGSRFTVGDSYDELIDRVSGMHYMGSSHLEETNEPGQDYALIASFRAFNGNRVIAIAGTRDAALMAAAEFVARPTTLAQLDTIAAHDQSFEALVAIPSLKNVGLDARLLGAWPRKDPTWATQRPDKFPDALSAKP
ncbi:hypothetical protein FHW96_003659 [Novosphingobium sp. SG751A]|uniref:helix-turn-helix domain-containing protein n=1 Tax=Novosphingobium sp. SG751A TaxID=2587000 RepID=UPI001556CE53|nr:helix-turn-helix domain-containing protein [Novosphingobium sp. SG751A]NOW47479.1 hypothetical protein [Novosphingobium sp. SG751A]